MQHSRRRGCCQQVSEYCALVVSQCAKVLLDKGYSSNDGSYRLYIDFTLYHRTQKLRNDGELNESKNHKENTVTEP